MRDLARVGDAAFGATPLVGVTGEALDGLREDVAGVAVAAPKDLREVARLEAVMRSVSFETSRSASSCHCARGLGKA